MYEVVRQTSKGVSQVSTHLTKPEAVKVMHTVSGMAAVRNSTGRVVAHNVARSFG